MQAVQGWCDGLLLISKTDMEGGDARAVAETMVDKAFVFRFGADGKPKIIMHKSALPFTPSDVEAP